MMLSDNKYLELNGCKDDNEIQTRDLTRVQEIVRSSRYPLVSIGHMLNGCWDEQNYMLLVIQNQPGHLQYYVEWANNDSWLKYRMISFYNLLRYTKAFTCLRPLPNFNRGLLEQVSATYLVVVAFSILVHSLQLVSIGEHARKVILDIEISYW